MVKIISDSSPLFTVEEAKAMGVDISPLCVSIGDLEGRDTQIDMDEFYGRISRGEIPRSSQPPIGEVIELYKSNTDCEIINIAMADGLSGTYQSACSAKEMADNSESISVFNSKTLCGPHRYMLETAQQMAKDGSSKEEILKWLEYAADHSESFLIPQDFEFLKRGGRLTPMAAALGSVLKLKPIMTLTEDCKKLDKFTIKKSMKSAVKAVIEHLQTKELDERHIIYVSHARALDDANKAIEAIKEAFPKSEVRMLNLGAAFVTQGGPQCIAIQYIEK